MDIDPKGDVRSVTKQLARSPVYELVSQSGPEHEKMFVSQVVWEGIVLGEGRSQQETSGNCGRVEAMQFKRWEKKREAVT